MQSNLCRVDLEQIKADQIDCIFEKECIHSVSLCSSVDTLFFSLVPGRGGVSLPQFIPGSPQASRIGCKNTNKHPWWNSQEPDPGGLPCFAGGPVKLEMSDRWPFPVVSGRSVDVTARR